MNLLSRVHAGVVSSLPIAALSAGLFAAPVSVGTAANDPGKVQPKAGSPEGKQTLTQELKWLHAENLTISTASLRSESVEHAPATVRVVSQRQIQERGYRNLEDLLKDLPGVDVLNHSSSQSKNRITIRGVSGNNKFLILQDGIRINSPTGESSIALADNFPLYFARQVEVLYGPASALYGADAFTGVINIITEEATREGAVRGEFAPGDFNTWGLSFFAAKRFSDWGAFSLGGHWKESDGADLSRAYPSSFPFGNLSAGAPPVVVVPAATRFYYGASSSFGTYAKLDLWENLTVGWNQSLFVAPTSEAGTPAGVNYNAIAEFHTLLLTLYSKLKFDMGERASGQVQANYSRYEQLPESKFNNTPTSFRDAFVYAVGERYQLESQFTLVVSPKHTLVAGANVELFHSIPLTANLPVPYDTDRGVEGQGLVYANTTLPIKIYEIYYYNAGAFAQVQTEWTDRFSTTLGLRGDLNQDFGGTINPRVGLVFQQSPETTLKMLYSRAYLAPSPFLRYENFGSFDGTTDAFGRFNGPGTFRVGNPDLRPEELQSIEVSFTHKVTDSLTFGLAAYYTLVDNLIRAAPAAANNTTFIPGAIILTPNNNQNIGAATARGFDITLDKVFRWERARLDLWSTLSIVHGRLTDRSTGRTFDLPFTSKEMFRAGATWNYNDRFIVTPSVQVNGSQASFVTSTASANFGRRVPGYGIVNLHAELRNASQSAAAFLRISNLTDERYFNAGPGSGGTFFGSPQDPRTIFGGVRLSF